MDQDCWGRPWAVWGLSDTSPKHVFDFLLGNHLLGKGKALWVEADRAGLSCVYIMESQISVGAVLVLDS